MKLISKSQEDKRVKRKKKETRETTKCCGYVDKYSYIVFSSS